MKRATRTQVLMPTVGGYKGQPLKGLAPVVPVDNEWPVCSTDTVIAVHPTLICHSLKYDVRLFSTFPLCLLPPSLVVLVFLGKGARSIHFLTRLRANHLTWEGNRRQSRIEPLQSTCV